MLFDLEPDPPEPEPGPTVGAAPAPGRRRPAGDIARRARHRARSTSRATRSRPDEAGARAGRAARPGSRRWPPPGSRRAAEPAQRPIGPHRRFAWVEADLASFKAIKDALGGTINDVVLTVVTGALRAYLIRHGRDPEGLELKAMVPISVRADAERGALGNQVAAMYAPLPVGLDGPVERFRFVTTRWAA